MVAAIVASEKASCAAFGSSTTMILPPSPVRADPTEVDRRDPFLSLSKRVFVFWSPVNLNLSPHND